MVNLAFVYSPGKMRGITAHSDCFAQYSLAGTLAQRFFRAHKARGMVWVSDERVNNVANPMGFAVPAVLANEPHRVLLDNRVRQGGAVVEYPMDV
jgi:hypothetical protein